MCICGDSAGKCNAGLINTRTLIFWPPVHGAPGPLGGVTSASHALGLSGGSVPAADLFACAVGGLTRAIKNEAKCILFKAGVQQLPLRGAPVMARTRKVLSVTNYASANGLDISGASSAPPRRSPLQPLRGGGAQAVEVPVARRVGHPQRAHHNGACTRQVRDNE
jgi:hypothetical protein